MRTGGSYRIAKRGVPRGAVDRPVPSAGGLAGRLNAGLDALLDPISRSEIRWRRILESLRDEIVAGGGGETLRIRQIFRTPREIYRLELELPELGYQRTTLLDREALEELLGAEGVQEAVGGRPLEG